MSIRNLDKLLSPASVVAIGATNRAGSVGEAVTRNLLGGGFKGEIHLVNLKGGEIGGRPVLKSVRDLKAPPDLAVIMTPPASVPRLVMELGQLGTRVAVVITSGMGEDMPRWRQRILDAAKPYLMRIVGPNCIGYAAPRLGLNAGFGPAGLKPGRIAAVAQSGAVLAGLADWGTAQNIGFSHLVSMGDMADVDFGDILDMLARDYDTRAVLMYVEGITAGHGDPVGPHARGDEGLLTIDEPGVALAPCGGTQTCHIRTTPGLGDGQRSNLLPAQHRWNHPLLQRGRAVPRERRQADGVREQAGQEAATGRVARQGHRHRIAHRHRRGRPAQRLVEPHADQAKLRGTLVHAARKGARLVPRVNVRRQFFQCKAACGVVGRLDVGPVCGHALRCVHASSSVTSICPGPTC